MPGYKKPLIISEYACLRTARSGSLVSKLKSATAFILLIVGFISLCGGSSLALSTSIAQGYTSSTDIETGMAVSVISQNGITNVTPANTSTLSSFTGVAVSSDSTLVSIVPAGSKVFVAGAGKVTAYVSNTDGIISKNTRLALSNLDGVLVKASPSQTSVGTALDNYPTTTQSLTVTKENGSKITQQVALISINLTTQPPTAVQVKPGGWLNNIGADLTGKKISEPKALVALIIFITFIIVEGELIYSVGSGAMIAVGRNPFAKHMILRQSIKNLALMTGTLIVATAAIGWLIWL